MEGPSIRRGFVAAFAKKIACGIMAAALVLLMCPQVSLAQTNSSASAALSSLQTKQYYKLGNNCPSGKNVGWLVNGSTNCKNECYAFARGVALSLYGSGCTFISGVTSKGYVATNSGSFNVVGTLVDTSTTQPSQSSVKSLLQKAYPGDVVQFRGGPSSYGYPQHTIIVQSVSDSGITVYEHLNSSHIGANYYTWDYFYKSYLDFDVYTAKYNKGLTLYHYKNYDSVFPSHTHNYNQQADVKYSYYNDVKHAKTYTKKCSCGATNGTATEYEACNFQWVGLVNKCTVCGTTAVYHASGGEYVAHEDAVIYEGDNPQTTAIGSIPKGTVVNVSDITVSSWGRYVSKVSYGGATGWVQLVQLRPNNTAGVHTFAGGKCSVCGVTQVPSVAGTYVALKDAVLYKTTPFVSEQKKVSAGETVTFTAVTATEPHNFYWGTTADGYVADMELFGVLSNDESEGTAGGASGGDVAAGTGADGTGSGSDSVASGDSGAGSSGAGAGSDDAFAEIDFPDVAAGSWYYQTVSEAASLGLMTGYSSGTFGPNDSLTRAQAAVVLWRYFAADEAAELGDEVVANTTGMSDVASYSWYTAAANWAVENGVINGESGVWFSPNKVVSREQLCQMVANAAKQLCGVKISGGGAALAGMPDCDSVADWSSQAVAWCLKSGVISGVDESGVRYVRPQSDITRAQMATIMVNAIEAGVFKG